jgi:hypothetical protein
MNKDPRVMRLYEKILLNLKKTNPTYKLCLLKRINKVDPFILKGNLPANYAPQNTEEATISCEGTDIAPPKHLQRAFKIIEPIIQPRIRLQNGDIELDQELQLYKTEIEAKYHQSSTNSIYRYPLTCVLSDTQLPTFGEEDLMDDMKCKQLISYYTLHHILSQKRYFEAPQYKIDAYE